MRQRNARTRAPQIERSLCCGIAAADDNRILVERLVTFTIHMRDMRKLFARDTEIIRRAEVSGGNDHSLRHRDLLLAGPCGRQHTKRVAFPLDRRDALVLSHNQPEMPDDLSIVRQRVTARRLLCRDNKRNPAQ